jgi:hypothetical protein
LRRFHAYAAIVLVAYASVHIANHLVGLAGIEAHLAFMESFRTVYRNPVVEAVLLAAVAFQIYSGATFVVRGWRRRRGLIPWLQAGSGAYLALFFLNHVGAVLFGRTVLGLDTNFYFAAAGFHVPPFQFFFAPYYFLAVLALFVHLGCALYWQLEGRTRRTRNLAVALPTAVGFAVSLAIVLMLAGAWYPVEVPPAYKATYGWEP